MKIKTLSPITINRIAAGEVVERPASAVKELIENSLDAGSKRIDIEIHNGGRNLVSISDDGCGMTKEELEIAIQRHTTSKLDETDITNIQHFGFRGEALPSIASVSRMTITSKHKDSKDHAWSININGGELVDLIPAALQQGTKIEVRDLFYSTPARLKFLKSERVETQHITDIVKKLAMAHSDVAFYLKTESKQLLSLPAVVKRSERIAAIMGSEFTQNSIEVNVKREGVELTGLISIPTFNRGSSTEQYLFVNNRPVRDKLLMAILKVSYQDFLSPNRYPVVALFMNIFPSEVDVNVHPTKAEVRFRDANHIRSIFISALKNALVTGGNKVSTTIAQNALDAFSKNNVKSEQKIEAFRQPNAVNFQTPKCKKNVNLSEAQIHKLYSVGTNETFIKQEPVVKIENQPIADPQSQIQEVDVADYPMGSAKCQLHKTYIVSQSEDSIIIVDQHAAHERLVYEKLKNQSKQNNIKRQRLLIPEIVEMNEKVVDKLIEKKQELESVGLIIEQNGYNAIRVTEIPAILGDVNVIDLIKNIGDDLLEFNEDATLSDLIEHIVGNFACHHSIRAGRVMSISEMNALLRDMENTPHSGQCNHGRPTYIELKLNDIEKLFGRS